MLFRIRRIVPDCSLAVLFLHLELFGLEITDDRKAPFILVDDAVAIEPLQTAQNEEHSGNLLHLLIGSDRSKPLDLGIDHKALDQSPVLLVRIIDALNFTG